MQGEIEREVKTYLRVLQPKIEHEEILTNRSDFVRFVEHHRECCIRSHECNWNHQWNDRRLNDRFPLPTRRQIHRIRFLDCSPSNHLRSPKHCIHHHLERKSFIDWFWWRMSIWIPVQVTCWTPMPFEWYVVITSLSSRTTDFRLARRDRSIWTWTFFTFSWSTYCSVVEYYSIDSVERNYSDRNILSYPLEWSCLEEDTWIDFFLNDRFTYQHCYYQIISIWFFSMAVSSKWIVP